MAIQIDQWYSFGLLCLVPIVTGASILAYTNYNSEVMGPRLLGIILIDFLFVVASSSYLLIWVADRLLPLRDPEVITPLSKTLIRTFAAVAAVPTAIIAVAISVALNFIIGDRLFVELRDELNQTRAAATSYFEENSNAVLRFARDIASKIDNSFITYPELTDRDLRMLLQQFQSENTSLEALVFIINGQCEIIARGTASYYFDYLDRSEPPANLLQELSDNQIVTGEPTRCSPDRQSKIEFDPLFGDINFVGPEASPLAVIYDSKDAQSLNALMKLQNIYDHYLLVIKEVSSPILTLRESLARESESNRSVIQKITATIFRYSIIILGVALVLVLIMMQFGFVIAERLSRPVKDLAIAAQRIGEGDLKVRINSTGSDEIAKFSRIFEKMVARLDTSITEQISLRDAAQQRENTFSEVLSNVTAGVIGINKEDIIVFMNRSAATQLGIDDDRYNQNSTNYSPVNVVKAVPEFSNLIDNLKNSRKSVAQDQLKITRSGLYHDVLVRIAKRTSVDGLFGGYVIAFDDVTELMRAQSKAAWSSAAQQIAHEVKNAMTPISLSIGLLEGRIGNKLDDESRKRLVGYTSAISESMNGLIRISQEFSKFARLPDPVLSKQEVISICNQVAQIETFRGEDVQILVKSDAPRIYADIDRELFHQALVNLVKNAREGLIVQLQKSSTIEIIKPQIIISVTQIRGWIDINVMDNGAGFPSNILLSDIIKPFVSFREGGSGLGLAYAERIAKGHGGHLELSQAPKFEGEDHQGAMVKFRLPDGV